MLLLLIHEPNIGGIADNELGSARTLSGEMTAANIAWPIPSQPSSISSRDWRFNVVKQALRQRYQAAPPNAGALWTELFPEPPQRQSAASLRVARRALVSVIALAAGAVVLLLRIAGPSPLTTIWAEDRTVFLVQALATPGHLFASYAGYLQLLPRLIAQSVSFLPLPEAAAAFALAGAVIASAVALFVFYASAGHIHSVWLRGLLAAAVLLLPVAPLEIADSGVNTPWYLLFALFWACLWRPRGRGGMALAGLIGFLAGASTPLALALAPLLILRMAALRRVREHAVTSRPGGGPAAAGAGHSRRAQLPGRARRPVRAGWSASSPTTWCCRPWAGISTGGCRPRRAGTAPRCWSGARWRRCSARSR